MRLKLDENLGHRGRELLERAGHDVATVPQQALTGATDAELIQRCTAEGRALVTLDLDFANPLGRCSCRFTGSEDQKPSICRYSVMPGPSQARGYRGVSGRLQNEREPGDLEPVFAPVSAMALAQLLEVLSGERREDLVSLAPRSPAGVEAREALDLMDGE